MLKRVEINNIQKPEYFYNIWMNNCNHVGNSDYQISQSKHNEQSYENSLCVKKEKKIKIKLRKERVYRQKKHGSWSKQEETKFVDYMLRHLHIFQDKQMRRKKKIFRQMAKFIKTRSSEQCRSHHQKYEIRFPCHLIMIQHINYKLKYGEEPPQLRYDGKNLNMQFGIKSEQDFYANVNHNIKITSEGQGWQYFPIKYLKVEDAERVTFPPVEQMILQNGQGYKVIEKSLDPLEILIELDMENFFV